MRASTLTRETRLARREPDNVESLVGRKVPNPEAVLGHAAPGGVDRETPLALDVMSRDRRAPEVRARRTSRAPRARLPGALRDCTPTPRSAWSARRCTRRVSALVSPLRKLARLGPAIELLARQRTGLATFARFDASAHVGLLVGRKAHERWEPRPGCHEVKPSSIRGTRNPGVHEVSQDRAGAMRPGHSGRRWAIAEPSPLADRPSPLSSPLWRHGRNAQVTPGNGNCVK